MAKKALILSGGGTKGSVQLGILIRLYEQGYRPDVIYGTSIGSLNGCALSHLTIEETTQIWKEINKTSDIFKLNWLGPLKQLLHFIFPKLVNPWMGIYNWKPLKEKVKAVTNLEPHTLAWACKVSLVTGEIKYVANVNEDYQESVVASCCVPVLTDPVGEWVDGGVREQTPLKRAIEDGADELVVVLCNPFVENPEPASVGNLIENLARTTDILSHEIFKNDIDSCLWYNLNTIEGKRKIKLTVYAPRQQTIGTSDFNRMKIATAIEYGYSQALLGPIIEST